MRNRLRRKSSAVVEGNVHLLSATLIMVTGRQILTGAAESAPQSIVENPYGGSFMIGWSNTKTGSAQYSARHSRGYQAVEPPMDILDDQ